MIIFHNSDRLLNRTETTLEHAAGELAAFQLFDVGEQNVLFFFYTSGWLKMCSIGYNKKSKHL
jgi:hypothetical protein